MKILIADQFSEPGGAQLLLLELLPALLRQGWSCVLAVPGRGLLRTRAENLGIRCEEISCGPFDSGAKSITDRLRFGMQFPKLRAQFRRLIDDVRPDVFYVTGPRLVPAACSLGSHAPPILFHVHSYLKQRYIAALTGRFLRHARASIVANCQYVLEPLRNHARDLDQQVIYNGVRDFALPERKSRTGRIGIIGRIAPDKGQKLFVQAARMLHSTMPQASFVICGGTQFSDRRTESYFNEVREAAAGLPIEFTGWQDDIGGVLRSLDLLVVASLPEAEATTRVIPEAFSAGVPVLASDLPGIREIIENKETGFLFPAGNAGALANNIRTIMGTSSPMLAAVRANARRQFEERFCIDVFHRRMVSNFERIAGTRL